MCNGRSIKCSFPITANSRHGAVGQTSFYSCIASIIGNAQVKYLQLIIIVRIIYLDNFLID